MGTRVRLIVVIVALVLGAPVSSAPLFQTSSKELGDGKMDIVVTEIERRPRTSVVDVKINTRRPEGVLELEQFAPLCGFLK